MCVLEEQALHIYIFIQLKVGNILQLVKDISWGKDDIVKYQGYSVLHFVQNSQYLRAYRFRKALAFYE
jgi:hypothetical protein